jgi:hypothetical protein
VGYFYFEFLIFSAACFLVLSVVVSEISTLSVFIFSIDEIFLSIFLFSNSSSEISVFNTSTCD